jgi:hypothetical protein
MTLVHWLRDPSLYPTDPIRETLPYYAFAVWKLIALLPQTVPLDVLGLILWAATRALLLYAAARLAKSLAPENALAPFAAMAMFSLTPLSQIGTGTIMSKHFEQTSAAIPFILLCVGDWLRKQYWRSGMWLGLVVNLTIVYGSYLVVYLFACGLLVPLYRAEWRRWLSGMGIAGVIAIPAFVLLVTRPHSAGIDVETLYMINRIRSPHHLFPLSFEGWRWLAFFLSLALSLLLIAYVRRNHPVWAEIGASWTVACLCFVCISFLAAYGVRSYWLLTWSTARATDVWICLIGVLLITISSTWLESSMIRPGYAPILIVSIWVLTVVWWGVVNRPKLLVGLMVITSLAVVACRWVMGKSKWQKFVYIIISQNMFVLLLLIVTMLIASHDRLSLLPSARMFHHARIYHVASWCKQYTPKEAVFLIPLDESEDWSMFRVLAQRGVFTTWKDGTHILFAPQYAPHWIQRIEAIGFYLQRSQPASLKPATLRSLYLALSDADVVRIASRFRVDYWIVPHNKPSRFPVVYQDNHWKVLIVDRGFILAPRRSG